MDASSKKRVFDAVDLIVGKVSVAQMLEQVAAALDAIEMSLATTSPPMHFLIKRMGSVFFGWIPF